MLIIGEPSIETTVSSVWTLVGSKFGNEKETLQTIIGFE